VADEQGKLSRAETRRMFAALPAKKRLDALLDLPQAKLAVQQVPAEDLYVAIAEVGLEDATEIVQLASPEQFQTFVDLAGWRKDHVSSHDVLKWLRAARGEDDEEFRAKLDHLDLEVLELLLRELTVTHDLEEDPDVQVEGMAVETPEGRYLVEIKAAGAEASRPRGYSRRCAGKSPRRWRRPHTGSGRPAFRTSGSRSSTTRCPSSLFGIRTGLRPRRQLQPRRGSQRPPLPANTWRRASAPSPKRSGPRTRTSCACW
jgi:hypothetical protein